MMTIRRPQIILAALGLFLLVIYMTTIQTIPNGSSHYYMIDVGETQIVLNNWGTLHATGYPLYVMSGNVLTNGLTIAGVSPVVAPALVSLLWGGLTLGLFFVLAHHLSGRVWIAAGVTVVFGLTRTVWIHHVIAEIYSFGLLLQLLVLTLALWREPIRGRIIWMAIIGGLAVGHHRATVMMIPGLLYAVWPHLRAEGRRLPRLVVTALLLGLLGLVPYIYLYLRAQAGADWVYGQPGTLSGLWDEFIGREANRFIGFPETFDALIANFNLINTVLIRDLTAPGIIAGLVGLGWGLRQTETRRPALTLGLIGLAAYGFHVAYYTDVLSALILLMTLPLAFGWVLLAMRLPQTVARYSLSPLAAALAVYLLIFNYPFIQAQVTNTNGLETAALVEAAPPESTVMLAWGPEYFAVSAVKLLLDDLESLTIVDDKVDYADYNPPIITPEYTLFTQTLDWWEARLGGTVYPSVVAPRLVALRTEPILSDDPPPQLSATDVMIWCDEPVALDVTWVTAEPPTQDLDVFVHGLDAEGRLVAQGDQFDPVYGWRPLSSWLAGERVRDIYPLYDGDDSQVVRIRYGFYRALPQGGFENVIENEIEVNCDDA